jgi:hypothetical protein
MNNFGKTLILALALGGVSAAASADDLIATQGMGKGGQRTVALDLSTGGDSTAFEFVVVLPADAKNVDVSGCMKGLPASHSAQCVYNEKSKEVTAIAFSATNAKLTGMLNLGTIRYNSLQKVKGGAKIQGLVVANGTGSTVPSEIQTEEASLGK